MNTLDMTGKPCPIPVVQAKKMLADPAVLGVEITVDNIVAVQNLEKMARGLHYGFSYTQPKEKSFVVSITREANSVLPTPATAAPQPVKEKAPLTEGATILITSSTLGEGAEELGAILMKGFIFSLTELSPLPKSVIFLNGGARLTCKGANTVADLQTLHQNGCEILTCGTCANYFELTGQLAVGEITDMMGITTRLAAAGHLITV